MRISNSFSEGEIQVMEFILQTLLRGGTPTMAVRNKDFASLYRKVMTMKQRVAEKKERDVLDQSAVGTTRAVESDEAEPIQSVG
ncbi:MAG: hypothetical protein GXY23_09905 [Myxococcales bacterium]|nr:hypothetical protein [Myxococcales bacterium]